MCTDHHHRVVILGGKQYLVGRRDCDILVANDATVSRKHAEISMTHPEANLASVSRLPILRLKDVSKFGTWVNNKKVEGEQLLSDGDSIYFGSQKSSFMVVFEPFVVTASCLESASKRKLHQQLCTLGGHVTKEWQMDCSCLLMNKISVTIKAICALVSQKPIVTLDYIDMYIKHLQGSVEKPDPYRFTPSLAETQLDPSDVSFEADSRRKTLFQGKTFVFLNHKQFNKMRLAIELAGGVPLLMEGKGDQHVILGPQTVVMNSSDASLTQGQGDWVQTVHTLLERNGKHFIQDAAIGYAVLYCSTEKHCNPEYSQDQDVSRLPSQTLSQADPFVANTDTQLQGSRGSVVSQRRKLGIDSQAAVNETRLSLSIPATPEMKCVSHVKSQQVPDMMQEETTLAKTTMSAHKRGRQRQDIDQETVSEQVASKRVKTEPVTPAKISQSVTGTGMKPSPAQSGSGTNKAAPFTQASKSDVNTNKRLKRLEEDWGSDDDDINYSSIVIEDIQTTEPRKSINESPSSFAQRNETKEQKSDEKRKSLFPFAPRSNDTQSSLGKKSRSRSRSVSPVPMAEVKQEVDLESGCPRLRVTAERPRSPISLAQCHIKAETIEALEHSEVETGFLSTRTTIQNQMKQNCKYELETDQPVAVVQVEVVSLVARGQKPKENLARNCADGFTRWKGKMVRNFKKFKKTNHAGSQSLPNIIGGSDLEVHLAQRSKELDDWFRETNQSQSQLSRDEERAEQLFNFDTAASVAKKQGR
ncbi:nibrin-like isoform X4 [Dreissena polymorpha]|uniref:nibrin-like isoform X4 n=1 Tax=Dreissena polymorpha TaxID=45954 RepID=UPI002264995E|nr:nibrin-like isoform X4 [Dreissena polymorpha]